MKYILILILFFTCSISICNAEQKIFYDKVTGMQVVDVSNKKTIEQIKQEFGLTDIDVITVDEKCEGAKIIDGQLTKYNHAEETREYQENKEAEEIKKNDLRELAENKLMELGLTQEEVEALR